MFALPVIGLELAIDSCRMNPKLCPMSGNNEDAHRSGLPPFIRRQWLNVIAASAMILCVVIASSVWLYQLSREPVYRGKPLSVWLRSYASSSLHSPEWNAADNAVRHIGTNGIPLLIGMIGRTDSAFKVRLVALVQKQRLFKIHLVPAVEQNLEASRAFIALGGLGGDAVPGLMAVYQQDITTNSHCAIEDALAWIGPAAKPAIPMLLRVTTNANPKLRANALWALGEIHAEPELCVPALIHALADADDWARLSAAHALGMFGADAKSAVPSLSALTNTSAAFNGAMLAERMQLRVEVRNALRKIEPARETVPDFGFPTAELPVPGNNEWRIAH